MIKQLFIKLGLWEDKPKEWIGRQGGAIHPNLLVEAAKHYCEPCNRWFSDVRGKLMHDRHRHKE